MPQFTCPFRLTTPLLTGSIGDPITIYSKIKLVKVKLELTMQRFLANHTSNATTSHYNGRPWKCFLRRMAIQDSAQKATAVKLSSLSDHWQSIKHSQKTLSQPKMLFQIMDVRYQIKNIISQKFLITRDNVRCHCFVINNKCGQLQTVRCFYSRNLQTWWLSNLSRNLNHQHHFLLIYPHPNYKIRFVHIGQTLPSHTYQRQT